jgi:hypothetical protein
MLWLLASCSGSRSGQHTSSEGTSLDAAYAQARRHGIEAGAEALRDELQLQGTLGYVRPHVPVRTPPNVMRVWIPTFEDAEHNLVQGHWVHVVIGDEGWYIGQQVSPVAAQLSSTPSTPHTPPSAPTQGGRR